MQLNRNKQSRALIWIGLTLAQAGFEGHAQEVQQEAATEIALEQGFPRIGLINGKQLVDILVEHWEDIPIDFKDKLNLKLGLVLS